MEAGRKMQLMDAGIDVDSALERFMGNEALLERMLQKFSNDPNYRALAEAAEAGQAEQALQAAHTLKGLCGNLSMGELFPLLTRQVELFRSRDEAGAFGLMPEISRAYDRALQGIVGALEK